MDYELSMFVHYALFLFRVATVEKYCLVVTVDIYESFRVKCYLHILPDDGDRRSFLNADKPLPNFTASHPTRQYFS